MAEIVADTMNGYLIYSHIMKCEVVDKVHPDLFKGAGQKFHVRPWRKMEEDRHNKRKTSAQIQRVRKRAALNQIAKQEKLEAMGVEYDFPKVVEKKILTDVDC